MSFFTTKIWCKRVALQDRPARLRSSANPTILLRQIDPAAGQALGLMTHPHGDVGVAFDQILQLQKTFPVAFLVVCEGSGFH